MTITTNRPRMTAVVDVEGHLAAGKNLAGLRQLASSAKVMGADHIVLNLAGVARLDCTGIGQLVWQELSGPDVVRRQRVLIPEI